MIIYLTAALGFIFLIGGIFIFILRRKGHRFFLTPEQQATEDSLRKAFGKNTKWGTPGATENELHDYGDHGGHSDDGGRDTGAASD